MWSPNDQALLQSISLSAAKLKGIHMEDAHTLAPVRTIKLPGVPANKDASRYYFPINLNQVRDLETSLFTRLEMLNLSKKAEDAAKVVFQEQIWQWFNDAQENSTTSYQGCIAPIVTKGDPDTDHDKSYPSNRWGWESEEAYEGSQQIVSGNTLGA